MVNNLTKCVIKRSVLQKLSDKALAARAWHINVTKAWHINVTNVWYFCAQYL